MSIKMTIIEVDLGIDVNAVIGVDARAIGGQNELDIQQAIDQARTVKQLADERSEREDSKSAVMDRAYEILIRGKECSRPIPWLELLETVRPLSDNANSFALRMKAYLRNHGGVYRMVSKRHHKSLAYVLMDYNGSETESGSNSVD